ncbi:RNA polymerase sigma factor [Segeticoccus rhizosphaerae]|jgi:RNA polymerase sigma factor (sigma-70 family)|uniref:RNA polymerase sigma factor n=1 Tax=Segeticoccus rhizosphaerae TaxID=1104777 RepID=UPI0010C0615F|nr:MULTISPECIES: sigma-70 family RNA polymerase sigma factor [Intrasporangiaceae]
MVDVDRRPVVEPRASLWSDAAEAFSRWREGDPAGLDDLVRLLSPVLWHVVRAYGLERDRAEDVVQTTWLTLVRRADSVKDCQAIGAWLTTTARREAWRQSGAESRTSTATDEFLADKVPPGQSAEAEVLVRDEQDRLWAGVRQLSDRCQRLLRIVAFSPRPNYTDLSDELGMPVGSIGPTRGRCLDKLRTLLTEPIKGATRVRV